MCVYGSVPFRASPSPSPIHYLGHCCDIHQSLYVKYMFVVRSKSLMRDLNMGILVYMWMPVPMSGIYIYVYMYIYNIYTIHWDVTEILYTIVCVSCDL